jgi:hypothetical protein
MNPLFSLVRKKSSRASGRNKNVVYTILIGEYDDLKEPQIACPDFDYICLTDRDDLTSPTWRFIKVKCDRNKPPKRCAASLITYPFGYLKDYELSVLVSGKMTICCDISDFVKKTLPADKSIAVMMNPKSDCIYIAAQNVLRAKKDKPDIVNRQMEKYRKAGYPEHNGLVSTGVMIRRHNDKNLRKHCRLWLREIKRHSQRDQLSFNYILWKYRLIDPVYFSSEVRNREFIIHPHNYRQQF